jgi:UDPglucose 6-dehydrogenase
VIVETDLERLADGCDAVVLVTDWQEFLTIDYTKMLTLMAHPVIIDARNFLDGKELKALGYHYIGIGR